MTSKTDNSGFDFKREYRQFVPIENLVTGQIGRIAEYRSKKMWEYYIESVEMLIDLLPPDLEETVLQFKETNGIGYDLSNEGKRLYVLLFRYIKQQLTKDNIVWKRSRGFEIGHE